MNEIKKLLEEINLPYTEISELLGKNKWYLYGVVNRGVSTEKQYKLIEQLKTIKNGGKVLSDDEIIADLTQKLAEAQDKVVEQGKAIEDLKDESDKYFNECNQLAEKLGFTTKELYEAKEKNKILIGLIVVVALLLIVVCVAWGLSYP